MESSEFCELANTFFKDSIEGAKHSVAVGPTRQPGSRFRRATDSGVPPRLVVAPSRVFPCRRHARSLRGSVADDDVGGGATRRALRWGSTGRWALPRGALSEWQASLTL